MSNVDSFIEEVTEEVRRDRMVAYFRRHGWIIGTILVLVVVVVGVLEWRKAATRSAAEARGSAIMAALEAGSPAAEVEALTPLVNDGSGGILARLALAGQQQAAGGKVAAASTLEAIATDQKVGDLYRDIARLKLAMLEGGELSLDEREAVLDPMIIPGHPLRLLALEQRAIARIDAGDTEAALGDLGVLYGDAQVPDGARSRASQLIISLGGKLPELVSAGGAAEADAGDGGAVGE